MSNLVNTILEYIKHNSIDFIAIISSVFIALETDRLINWRKDKKAKQEIADAIFNELNAINIFLIEQDELCKKQHEQGTMFLRLSPYSFPYWNSIQNTERIELFSSNSGYWETISIYSELTVLNQWENIQTQYILFNNYNEQYISDLAELISLQRTKCLNEIKKALIKIKGDYK